MINNNILFNNINMPRCLKCNFYMSTPKQTCFCNKKTFDGPKIEKKGIKPISDKKKDRLENNWTEIQIFIKRFNQLKDKWKNYCMVSGVFIEPTEDNDLEPSSFPHILPKWKYPEFRYFLNNIGLVLWITEHKLFDQAINRMKDDIWLAQLILLISSWEEIDIQPYLINE